VRRATFVLLSLAALAALLGGAARGQSEEPEESSVEERIEVQLVEIKVSVRDGLGNPVTDIGADEVRVFENGRRQKLAFFEPVAEQGWATMSADQPAAATLYDTAGGPTGDASDVVVLPPKPTRRIFFVFDVWNSRRPIREEWRTAAVEWAQAHWQEGDRAGAIVLRQYPDWAGPVSEVKAEVVNTLQALDLYTDVPDRNRRQEVTEMMESFRSLCLDNKEGYRFEEKAGLSGRGSDLVADVPSCLYNLSRPLAFEWKQQSAQSVDVLQFVSGQLAAIPGQKIVVLFSEGIIDDPAMVLVNAMLNLVNYEDINMASMLTRLGQETTQEISRLQERAAASGVTFFTLDTRPASDGSTQNNLEQSSMLMTGNMTFNPWKEMYEATRGTLSSLAYATGGRPFSGSNALVDKIDRAAGSFYGIYNLGYYRSEPWRPKGKVKVKIDRKKLVLDYEQKTPRRSHRASLAPLDLVIGRPETLPGDAQLLPVSLLTPIGLLPLRSGAGGRGCEVGVFVQAVRPDGSVVAENFETLTIVMSDEEYREVRSKQWQHIVHLEVPRGPMRLRARVSDDRQEIVGDRSVDLTVLAGDVRGGLTELSDLSPDLPDAPDAAEATDALD
jgi:VWFA-related protein